jgi:hypothetical protein
MHLSRASKRAAHVFSIASGYSCILAVCGNEVEEELQKESCFFFYFASYILYKKVVSKNKAIGHVWQHTARQTSAELYRYALLLHAARFWF